MLMMMTRLCVAMDVISGSMYHVISIIISEDIYDNLVQAPSTDPWYCCSCIDLAVESNCPRQSSSLHCISFNARSIFPKRFTLLAYLSTIDADVVAITETFLDQSILSSQFMLKNYVVFRKDRNKHGGGVMLLVRSSIPAVRMMELESDCEILSLQFV